MENKRLKDLSDCLRHHTNMNFETLLFTRNGTLFLKMGSGSVTVEKKVLWYDEFDEILNQATKELTDKLNLPVLSL